MNINKYQSLWHQRTVLCNIYIINIVVCENIIPWGKDKQHIAASQDRVW